MSDYAVELMQLGCFHELGQVSNDVNDILRIPCDVYSRVVGFLTPVSRWNKGKKQEWKERTEYKLTFA